MSVKCQSVLRIKQEAWDMSGEVLILSLHFSMVTVLSESSLILV